MPKTAENFRSLCVGDKGIGKKGKPLHYKGSIFHRSKQLFKKVRCFKLLEICQVFFFPLKIILF